MTHLGWCENYWVIYYYNSLSLLMSLGRSIKLIKVSSLAGYLERA